MQVAPPGMSLRGSCPKASHHSSQDRGVPRYVCLPKESRGKDCSHFKGRQVQRPRVKSTPEDPSSSVRPDPPPPSFHIASVIPVEAPLPEVCLPFQGLLCPLEPSPEAGKPPPMPKPSLYLFL